MYPNPLRQKLGNGELILGTVLPALSNYIATQTCLTDIDFLWIDTEHAPEGVESLGAIPVLARQKGVAPLIRVAWNDPHLIKKAYDAGAVAVMVPQVSTAAEAALAVQYARYPPLGQRGVSPMWPLVAGEDWATVVRTANDETVLVLQIESVQAYENLDAIARVPGIDVLFVGPTDLSASLGVITQTDAPQVQAIMREIPRRLQGSGIAVGTTLESLSEIQEKIDWGYRFLNVGSPLGYGLQALTANLATLRGGQRRA
ncbi:MAG: 2-dehydro-3-deoxyglucarate aldolase [Caldilinea sp. CFX5]|nr:2-dehydro-3-deoxyglucarate aldolase [Caldilinea sp. CFX5]